MKPRILSAARLSLPLATALAVMLSAPSARAQTWDGGGTNSIWGGNNNWNPNGSIASGVGATATFGTGFASGTNIQVNTNRTIGNINHNSATTDITISQINSSIFTLDVTTGSPTVTVGTAARTLTITAPISGNDGLTKAGAGTCILSGLNLFAGNVSVNAGTLVAGVSGTGGNSALGGSLAAKTINVNTGGTLRFDVGNVFNNNFASAASSVPALNIAGGTMTNGGTATNSALGDLTLAGGTLTATVGSGSGYGSWNLNGTVTSTGASTISTSAGVPITLSAAAGTTTTFDVQSGTLTASAALGEVTAVGDEKISGLTKIGAGNLLLSGVNTYTGNTAINEGTLTIATKDALPGYNTSGRFSVAGGAILAVQNGVLDSEITEMLATTNFGSGANLGFDTAAGSRDLPLNLADTANGPLGVVKLGANTLTLSGTNNYTGGTNVLAGALNISSTSSLPGWNVNGGFSIPSGTSLIIPNGVSESEVTTMLGTTNIAAGATLSFDTSLGDRVYSSAVTDSLQGLLNVQKIGSNALTLAGTNSYTGNTVVTSGTLNITGTVTGNTTSSTLAIGNSAGNTVVNVSNDVSVYSVTGGNNAGSSAIYNQTAGTVTTSTPVQFGSFVANNGGYGYFNLTGGTFQNTQGSFNITNNNSTASTGVAYVAGNLDLSASTGNMVVAYSASTNGSVTVAPGGTMNYGGSGNTFFLTVSANSYGVLNVAGGNVDFGTRAVRVGNAGAGQTGILNLAGGTLTLGQNFSTLATTSNFHVNLAGGTLKASANLTAPFNTLTGLTVTSTIFGAIDNSAALGNSSQNFTGGLTVDTNGFDVSLPNPLLGATGNGVKQVDMTVTGGSGYTGAPMVAFTGGTLAPGGTPASGYAMIDGGEVTGIVITSPGAYTVDPTVTLTGGGGSGASVALGALTANASDPGLVKTGSGTLSLPGANTYTGATSVNAGTLNITGTLTSNVTVASNADLGGEGSTTGSLTFSGNSRLNIDPSTGTALAAATVDATGAAVTVAPTIPFTGTGIVVLDAPGGITGTAGGAGNNFIYTGRGNLYFNGGNTQLLVDTAPVSLTWLGNDGTNPSLWDLNTTTNWDNSGSEKFFTGDAITFDDTASSFTVNIDASNVFPGNITFNNTTTYTIQGAFGIYGGATLTKNGTGTTVIDTSNGYTGVTTVNAGVLNIRTATALGDVIAGTSVTSGAALEIQGGIAVGAEALTLNGSGILNSGALRSISGNNSWGAAVALGSDSTIGVDAGTLTIPSLTGAFGLTKVGTGTLNITGATAVTSTTVEAGTLYMGTQSGASTTTTLGASNPVTLSGSSNLTIRRTNTGVSNLLGAISGTGSLTLLGDNANTRAASDFALNDASSFSGGTTVIGARANITTSGSALGTGLVTTGANGQVFVQTTALTLTNDLSIGGIGWDENSGYLGALRLNSTTLSGDISLTSNARITGAGTSELSGVISGGFGMDFFEDTVIGTIILSGENDYTGQTIINSMGAAPATLPNLIVAHNKALGTTAGGTIVNGTGSTSFGSQLTLAEGITVTNETLTLDSTATPGYRASLVTAGTATWDGNVITAGSGGGVQFYANGASLTIGSSDTDTITGTNSLLLRGTGTGTVNSTLSMGANGFVKTDASTWTITSNNNDFTGTPAISNGILSIGSIADAGVNSGLGAGTEISFGQNSATSGTGTLLFTGAAGGSSNRALLINNGASGGGAVIENTVSGQTLALSGALTVSTPASASSLTLAGAGNGLLSAGITGAPLMALEKTGAGTWTLTGVNTYTGTTTIDQGTLSFATTNQSLTGGLTFGSSNGSTNTGILDLSNASATFDGATLVRTNSATANIINIGATQSLSLNGGLTLGYDAAGGTDQTDSKLTATGMGSMAVNGTTITVSANQAAVNAGYWNKGTLDVSGLAAFSTDVTNFNIGVGNTTQGPGDVILSDTANTILATTLQVGVTGANNGRGTSTLTLGAGTNVIQSDTIHIGRNKSSGPGVVTFASQTVGSPGTVTISDKAGTGRANIDIANQLTTATGGGAVGNLDLRGHVATVSAGTVTMGSTAANSNSGSTNGTLSFDDGSFDVNTLNMAPKSGNGTGTARGTLNIGGGTFTVNTAFTLGSQSGNGASLATVNLTGGTLSSFASILDDGGNTTSKISLDGGTLNLNGNAIGGATAIDTLEFNSGELQNVASINNTGGITKTTAGTLLLSGTTRYVGNTTVSEGTLTLSSAHSALNANPDNDLSTVTIAATGATLDLAFTGTDVVNELYIGGVLKAAGVWGAVGSGAQYTDSRITGTGTLTVTTGAAGGFAAWAATGTLPGTVTFGGDLNGDGVQDGMAFLLGVANPDDDANGSLPTVSESGGALFMEFNCLATADRGTSLLDLQYDGNLAGTWLSASVPGVVGNSTVNTATGTIDFGATANGTLIRIVATISDATESVGGKLFGRLEGTE